MSKRQIWILSILCAVLIGLAGQTAARAEPAPAAGYALGAYSPDEQVEYLDPAPGAAMTTLEAPPGTCATAGTFEEQVVCLVNWERRARNLYPYKPSPALVSAAEAHSAYMRDNECFSHECSGEPSPAQRACAAGYTPYSWGDCFIGETIAAGYLNPAEVVTAWMDSDGHRALLLHGQLREFGVGYVDGGYYGHYWTIDFGSQPDVLPVFVNYDDLETANPQVTLTLTNEEVSGCSGIDYANQVMLSNDPGFAGASWQPYSLHTPWQLPNDNGSQTVYVQYRDSSGDQVLSADAILLNVPHQFDLQVSAPSVIFVYEIGVGFSTPASRQVAVSNAAGSTAMSWHVQSTSGEDWLQASPDDGTTPGSVLVSVAGFETTVPGSYQATLTLTSVEDPDNPEQMMVTAVAVEQLHRVMLPVVTTNH